MPEQLTNKNVSQDNIAKDLQNMLNELSLDAASLDNLMQDLLIYIVNRDLKVFQHGYKVGTHDRINASNGDSNINLYSRSNDSQSILRVR
jgi:hypothetical protein